MIAEMKHEMRAWDERRRRRRRFSGYAVAVVLAIVAGIWWL